MAFDKKTALKKAKYALRFLPDRAFIQLYYFSRFHHPCDLEDPKTYNEKLNWLKLHDRNPRYIAMVDKAEAKEIAAEKIGREHIIPTLGVWDSFDDIDFDDLPEQFVLKCTHDSEGVVVVRDKSKLDMGAARETLERAMGYNFYYIGREWPYKNVKPRILAERYMEDTRYGELRDYRFFCFDGEPKAMFVATDRGIGETKFDYFDLDFNHLDLVQHYPNSPQPIDKPETFDEMIEAAKLLGGGYPSRAHRLLRGRRQDVLRGVHLLPLQRLHAVRAGGMGHGLRLVAQAAAIVFQVG
jgi:hypothetical protein